MTETTDKTAAPAALRYRDVGWSELWRVLRTGARFMRPAERRRALLVSGFVAISELAQAFAVLLVVPLISVIVEPDAMSRSGLTQRAYAALGNPSEALFVPLAACAVMAAFVASQGLVVASFIAVERFVARVQARFAHDVMDEILEAPYPWFFGQNAASLGRLFQLDLQYWGRDFVGNAMRLLTNAMTIIAGITILVLAAPDSNLLLLLGLAAIGYFGVRLIRPHVVRASTQKRAAAETMVLMANQIMSGMKDVKANLTQASFLGLFSDAYARMCRSSARSVIFGQLPGQAMNLIGPVAMVAILLALWLGGTRGGELAALMAVIAIVTARVLPAVARMQSLLMRLFDAAPWIRGVGELRDSIGDAVATARPAGSFEVPSWEALHFDAVTFVYPESSASAVHGLDLVFARGSVTGLVGPSGAGKSTCVDLLLGLLEPTEGAILVGDLGLADIDPLAWRARIGYVPQMPYFLDASIRENIVFGFDAEKVDLERLDTAVRLAGLSTLVTSIPDGLDARLGDRAIRISGGQRQRVAIARALYREPELLILDEATAALDAENEQIIVDTIGTLKGRVTTVVVSHRMTTLANCDRIYRLDQGRLVPDAPMPHARAGR